jgi:hypothetical protein
MSRRRFHRTDLSQPDIVQALRDCGDYVAIIGRPVDLLVRTANRYWTAECKTPGQHAKDEQPAQIQHRKDASGHGAPHFTLQTVEDAIQVRNALVAKR